MMAVAAGLGALTSAAPSRAQDAPGNKTSVEAAGEGKDLYEQICQACHMPDAKGGAGAGTGVPALAGNAKLADKGFAVTTVYNGRGGMPRFAGMLTDAQIAAVLTYVRGHFNTYPDPVTEADVKALAGGPIAKSDCNTCVH
ncbi:MAG TPA: cytochrome c [Novosphingobium sp.]|nr:cytochrome c [Novosphingobium sp.]